LPLRTNQVKYLRFLALIFRRNGSCKFIRPSLNWFWRGRHCPVCRRVSDSVLLDQSHDPCSLNLDPEPDLDSAWDRGFLWHSWKNLGSNTLYVFNLRSKNAS
jgi:hypothetical protein